MRGGAISSYYIAKAKLAELCGCVGAGELDSLSLARLPDDARSLQWFDKLTEDHEECAGADYPNLRYSTLCNGSEGDVFKVRGNSLGLHRRLCRERVGDVCRLGHKKIQLAA